MGNVWLIKRIYDNTYQGAENCSEKATEAGDSLWRFSAREWLLAGIKLGFVSIGFLEESSRRE